MRIYLKIMSWLIAFVVMYGFISPYLFSQASSVAVLLGVFINIVFVGLVLSSGIKLFTKISKKLKENNK
jgi:hypothetical protein